MKTHLERLEECYQAMLSMPRPQPWRAVKIAEQIRREERRLARLDALNKRLKRKSSGST